MQDQALLVPLTVTTGEGKTFVLVRRHGDIEEAWARVQTGGADEARMFECVQKVRGWVNNRTYSEVENKIEALERIGRADAKAERAELEDALSRYDDMLVELFARAATNAGHDLSFFAKGGQVELMLPNDKLAVLA